jgi:3',5'-nucleoside bisphosphate phosphatase
MTDHNIKKVDLHLHSNQSDGVFSPQKLITIIAAAGLTAAALTDHDTLAGLKDASEAAAKNNIEFVPGVEISVVEEQREIHILGYYPQDLDFLNSKLDQLKTQRFKRMEKTVMLLKNMGFKITYADVVEKAGCAAPGRLHLARVLLEKKYIRSLEEAFKLYLGFGKPAYIPRQTLSLAETFALLKKCGAIPVIAHPGKPGIAMLPQLITLGLKGVEVFHPDHNKALTLKLLQVARNKNLLVTGGSDFHGSSEKNGGYPFKLAIDFSYYQDLKAALTWK